MVCGLIHLFKTKSETVIINNRDSLKNNQKGQKPPTDLGRLVDGKLRIINLLSLSNLFVTESVRY